jgi:RHS repeat-associated protein
VPLQLIVANKQNVYLYDELVSGGFLYNYFRDYNPKTGRYVESDPIGLEGGLNTYAYVDGNPTGQVDPAGLWASQMGAYVHQRAGYLVFGNQITQSQLAIVARGQEWADASTHQTAAHTFMHAMRRPGQSVSEACAESNRFLKTVANDALAAQRAGKTNEALFLFAVALHTIQDSTSPSHRGFQEWSGNETASEVAAHVGAEVTYPGRGSDLDLVTRQAWSAFRSGNVNGFRVNCSCD